MLKRPGSSWVNFILLSGISIKHTLLFTKENFEKFTELNLLSCWVKINLHQIFFRPLLLFMCYKIIMKNLFFFQTIGNKIFIFLVDEKLKSSWITIDKFFQYLSYCTLKKSKKDTGLTSSPISGECLKKNMFVSEALKMSGNLRASLTSSSLSRLLSRPRQKARSLLSSQAPAPCACTESRSRVTL